MARFATTETAPTAYAQKLRRQGFEIQHRIGTGLSGTVYRGWQPSLKRPVAIKFFDNPYSSKDAKLRLRFEREGKLLAKCQHPRIPYVLTLGTIEDGDVPYIVLEFVSGSTLREELEAAGGALEVDQSLTVAIHILEALAKAHAEDVVHRDVKPTNIMCSQEGCSLIDFSIGVDRHPSAAEYDVTAKGERVGTPKYAAPEQLDDSSDVGPQADVFSLGLCLFEMLTGIHDRQAAKRAERELVSFTPELREVVRKACTLRPDERFADANEMLKAIRPFAASHQPILTATTVVCVGAACWDYDNWNGGTYTPRYAENVTDPFCEHCGSELIRGCSSCGAEIAKFVDYCAKCGSKYWGLGECGSCGSELGPEDLGRDTVAEGCAACEASRQTFDDDEIPF